MCNRVPRSPASGDEPRSDVLGMNRALLEENGRRQDLASFLQGRHHKMSLEVRTVRGGYWEMGSMKSALRSGEGGKCI